MEGTSLVDTGLIDVNPEQPRKEFNEELLEELAASIKTLGMIQPVTLRKTTGGRYQLVSGEKAESCSHGRIDKNTCLCKAGGRWGFIEMALVENIQRENLDAMEIAFGFQRLIEECSLTQEQLAERVGKKRATVANYLRLIQLPAQIQVLIRAGALTMGHARALLSIADDAEQLALAGRIVEQDLSVRQVEGLARATSPKKRKEEKAAEELPDVYYRVLEKLEGTSAITSVLKETPGRRCFYHLLFQRSGNGIFPGSVGKNNI